MCCIYSNRIYTQNLKKLFYIIINFLFFNYLSILCYKDSLATLIAVYSNFKVGSIRRQAH